MKIFKSSVVSLSCILGLLTTAAAQPTQPSVNEPAASKANAAAAASQSQAPPAQPEATPAQDQTPPAEEPASPARDQSPAQEPAAPSRDQVPGAQEQPQPPDDQLPAAQGQAAEAQDQARPSEDQGPLKNLTATPSGKPTGESLRREPGQAPAAPARVVADGEKELRLNFRSAPLDLVLNYLSEAAGFIIDLQTDVKGKVDVWSNQPLTKDEAVEVLNSALNRNGYAAIRNGRMLTIISRDEAKTHDIRVIRENDPARIPKSDEIVTQIIPVRFINASQLTKDLQPLLPTKTTMTANEGGNSLVITDTQVNIRRMAEIVRALDTAISSTSAIRVFPLKYADAKALATVVRELFASQDSAQRGGNNPMQQFFRGMRGGGAGLGGDQGGGSGGGSARVATPRVVATSDERSNSLVVSAPEDQMLVIEDMVKQVDTNVEDITELRVFRLRYADAQETADLLASLFPDSSNTQGNRGQVQFGGGRFGGRFGGASSSTPSDRLQKQTRVVAVADVRTGSVVVSAARNLMDQIAGMIEELDSDPAKKQKVFVFDVQNTDPQAVQDILQGLFPSQNYGTSANTRNTTRQAGNQLNNRATQTQNQSVGRNTSSGFGGSTGFGGTGGTGGMTGR